jgi:hypothetical protein
VLQAATSSGEPIHSRTLDSFLFPKNKAVRFLIVSVFSVLFAFLLVGKQVFAAKWGLIDDHEVFEILGRHTHLSLGEAWNAVILKMTEGPIFRPTYYATRILEIWAFGANVHLWYLFNTICFAIFLGCAWWVMWPFLGGWLSGSLTAFLALLPLWTGVWSRLGPSEIYGAACLGVAVLCASQILTASSASERHWWAIALVFATVLFTGMKETFLPFGLGPACLLFVLAWAKRLPRLSTGLLLAALAAWAGWLAAEIYHRTTASGVDYYDNPVGVAVMARFAVRDHSRDCCERAG